MTENLVWLPAHARGSAISAAGLRLGGPVKLSVGSAKPLVEFTAPTTEEGE